MTEEERILAIRRRLSGTQERAVEAMPTGVAELDAILPGGGLPRGHIVELYGPESSGKTTLALRAAAAVQAAGGTVALIDADHTFDPAQARDAGVDVERLVVASPQYEEQALEIIRTLAGSGVVELIIVDNTAALVPQLELETNLESIMPGLQGTVLSRGLRTIALNVRRKNICALFLNQLRSTAEGGETSAAGRGLKFYAAVRIELRPAPGARKLHVRLVRNKLGALLETDLEIR